MDGYRLAVVFEHDDFEKAAGSVGADVQVGVALVEDADGVMYRVLMSRSPTPCSRASSAISKDAGYPARRVEARFPAFRRASVTSGPVPRLPRSEPLFAMSVQNPAYSRYLRYSWLPSSLFLTRPSSLFRT